MFDRRVWYVVAWVILSNMFFAGGLTAADRPNFIVFIADDMAWNDCGAYGHAKIRTPGIDRLAREGMRFDNAFLTCSSCSPSRSSLITGRYPHNTGAHQLHLPLPGDQVTFVELLKNAGYYTAAAGKWHLGPATIPKFDLVEQKMNRWVKTVKERPRERPFFMWFAFTDPHRPYQADTIPKPHTPDDVIVPPYLPDVPETRRDLALYYDEVARLDSVVGNVLDELAGQGVDNDTMVVFMSDNGRPFPRCKTTIYNSGVKTPWIVRWPGTITAGSTTDSLISSIDLAPTVLELAGLKPGPTFQGYSFASILKNPQVKTRDYIFAEHNWHDFDDHSRSAHSKQYNYIRNFYPDFPGTPPADAVRSPTYQAMIRLREENKLKPEQLTCFTTPRPREELYDVVNDPHELNNLVNDSKYADVLAQMRGVLDKWQAETNDLVPEQRRPNEFDRTTGQRLTNVKRGGKPKKRVKANAK